MPMHDSIYILGISAFYHDSAACLIKNGEILSAVQEERFTRKKHDASFPKNAINDCMEKEGIGPQDLACVCFYEKPFVKFERILLTYLQYAPIGFTSFLKAMPRWLKGKLFLKDDLSRELNFAGKILFSEHHESHAASAFYPSPFKEAAILTVDGVGEWATASCGIGKDNKIELMSELHFPHSLGLLYSAFTSYTGFKVNSGEYKMMGLAPYGEPRYADLIRRELIDIKQDGSFKLNMKYFDFCVGLTMTNKKFHNLFGGSPRIPESKITQKDMDIARSIQVVTEEIMLKMANGLYEKTGLENLCLAGGVALNCVVNGKILRKSKFKNLWIQPAAGDAGGALGAAFLGWYRYLKNERKVDGKQDCQKGSYLGPFVKKDEVELFFIQSGIPFEKVPQELLLQKIAQFISEQKIVGLFQGRMEYGPRALGHRSILADARSAKMQSILNQKIKFRESFRPFGLSILEERLSEYFDLDSKSPYMLLTATLQAQQIVKPLEEGNQEGLNLLRAQRSTIPAATHVDHSSRIQTVSQERDPFYYGLIKEFENLTGCPMIINTSFNVRGEPMVCTYEEAYACFMSTDMDYLVIENYLFDKSKQPSFKRPEKENEIKEMD